jgi:hypothetical protein
MLCISSLQAAPHGIGKGKPKTVFEVEKNALNATQAE